MRLLYCCKSLFPVGLHQLSAPSVCAMVPCILTVVLIGQALLQGSVLASDTKASLLDRANTIFDLLAFDRHHRHSKKSICEQTDWRKQSLKLVKEIPFAGLFQDLQGESKFEASGLVHVNDTYYVVFDRCSAKSVPAFLSGTTTATGLQQCGIVLVQSPKSWRCQ